MVVIFEIYESSEGETPVEITLDCHKEATEPIPSIEQDLFSQFAFKFSFLMTDKLWYRLGEDELLTCKEFRMFNMF